MEAHLGIVERFYDRPASVHTECTAYDAALVAPIPKQQVSHSFKQCLDSHVAILFCKGHIPGYQVPFAEERQWFLEWLSWYVYDLLEVICKYVFVVIVRFGQIASCRYFGERVGFHMIDAICCFLRIIRYHTTHEKSLLYRMIQAVLAQRPTASSWWTLKCTTASFISQVDASFLLLLHKDGQQRHGLLLFTSLVKISRLPIGPLTLQSYISVKDIYLSCAGYWEKLRLSRSDGLSGSPVQRGGTSQPLFWTIFDSQNEAALSFRSPQGSGNVHTAAWCESF